MSFRTSILTLAATVAAASIATTPAQAREQINIVGSSTVFPFATAVAERFGKNTDFKTPVVESTGSGGGLKLLVSAGQPAAMEPGKRDDPAMITYMMHGDTAATIIACNP